MATHGERSHAICSASSAERWLACVAAPAMEELAPLSPPSPYAEEGTKAHELIEHLLNPLIAKWNKTRQIDKDAIDKISINAHLGLLPVPLHYACPPEMIDHAATYCVTFINLVTERKPRKVFLEERVELFPQLSMYGTADAFYSYQTDKGRVLSIWDFKYGKGKVVEANSPQLIYYAAAVRKMYPTASFDVIELNVYQPRASHDDGILRTHILTSGELDSWTQKFFQAGSISMDLVGKPKDKLQKKTTAGDHCGFCRAKPICDTHANYLNERAGFDFMDDPDLLVPVKADWHTTITDKDKERIAAILSVKKDIESYLSSVQQAAMNLILSGGDLPGWKIVEGRSVRKWRKDAEQVAKELQSLGVQDPWDKKIRGLGSVESELRKLGMKPKEVRDVVSPLVEMSSPSFSLAPLDDPRPAVEGSEKAQLDFTSIDAEFEEVS